jgi:ketosteroid isomerase-like protein
VFDSRILASPGAPETGRVRSSHEHSAGLDAQGDAVVLARHTAADKATGKRIDVRVAHHFIVRGGLIVRFEQFVDTALVRAAMSAEA